MTTKPLRLAPKSVALVRGTPLGDGGVRRVIESWARVLGRQGHRVSVVTEDSPSDAPLPEIPGVVERRYAAPAIAPPGVKLLISRRNMVAELTRLRDARGLDLLLCHDALSVAALRAQFPRVPVICTFHSPLVEENELNNWRYAPNLGRKLSYPVTRTLAERIDRQALTQCHHAHTLSDYTWELLRARYGNLASPSTWTKIPGTYDEQRFVVGDRVIARRELGLPRDELILLSVRRLYPRYGVSRIIAAARAVREAGFSATFLVGGKGDLLEPLKRAAQTAGLSNCVRFLGFLPEQRLPTYYQAANAFLLPTEQLECFGLPVIEAMASGAVPLITPCGGPEEICHRMPDLVSVQNSERDFVELVLRFVRGEISYAPAELNREARRYSEQAIAPAVQRLTARFLGVPQLVANHHGQPPANINTSITA